MAEIERVDLIETPIRRIKEATEILSTVAKPVEDRLKITGEVFLALQSDKIRQRLRK